MRLVREQTVRELPTLYSGMGQKLAIQSVPMNREMQKQASYTFQFYPKAGIKWVIINGDYAIIRRHTVHAGPGCPVPAPG